MVLKIWLLLLVGAGLFGLGIWVGVLLAITHAEVRPLESEDDEPLGLA